MTNADLAFWSPDVALSVRAFSVKDGISRLFDVLVTAGTTATDLDLDAIVGHPAAFRLATHDPDQPYVVWSGICSEIEQVSLEEDGLSIYALRIVPLLWRAGQRRNFRVYQHMSAAEIAVSLLEEWGIEVAVALADDELPRHEYRVQFGESDLAFISRILEEDGVSYLFEQVAPKGAEKKTEGDEGERLPSMRLVLTARPGETGKHLERAIPYEGHTEAIDGAAPYVSKVRIGRQAKPGRFTLGGYDYRSSPELRLLVEARSGIELEERYEQFHFRPGAFLCEHRPGGVEAPGDRQRGPGAALDEAVAKRNAQLGLERQRMGRRQLSLTTNQLVLRPGVVFHVHGHPRRELDEKTRLLVTSRAVEGTHDGEWTSECEAIFALDPFRPPLVTPKPRVMGVQSAIVVGPEGEEIYTDPLGRVRVQFHWDRYGQRDELSSCWIRVSQGWAGSGYGFHALPRVGHEVLVDFFEGDPDQPIIVGRVHHRGATPPDALPKDKTKTSWKSATTPGGQGFNEISMDDARGEELLYLRAQKDLQQIVLADQRVGIGQDLTTSVRRNESRSIGGEQAIEVKGDQRTQVDGVLTASGSRGLQIQAGTTTGLSCIDGKLVLSNGQASIVLDGPNLYIDAEANLRMSASRLASLNGREVKIDGRPEVFINSGSYVPPQVVPLILTQHATTIDLPAEGDLPSRRDRGGSGRPRRPGGMNEARFDGKGYLLGLVNDQLGTKLKWPKYIHLPPEYDAQLERAGRVAYKLGVVKGELLDPETYENMRSRVERRLNLERARLEKLGNDARQIFSRQAAHVDDVAKRLGQRLSQERDHLSAFNAELGEIFAGNRGNLWDSGKALYGAFRDQAKRIMVLRDDLKAMLDRELRYFERFKREWTGYYHEVKGYIDGWKEVIDNPKDALIKTLLGDDSQLAQDITSLADEFGYGDEAADFFGLDDGGGGGHQLPDGHQLPEGGHEPPHTGSIGTRAAKRGKLKRLHGKRGPKLEIGGKTPGGLAHHPHQRVIHHKGLPGLQQMSGQGSGFGQQRFQPTAGAQRGPAMLSRSGGIGAGDVAASVRHDKPTLLQSPGDGQLLVMPDSGAQPVDPSRLSDMMVDAQMAGRPASTAIETELEHQGYRVYRRDYGDWMSEFVRQAEQQA